MEYDQTLSLNQIRARHARNLLSGSGKCEEASDDPDHSAHPALIIARSR